MAPAVAASAAVTSPATARRRRARPPPPPITGTLTAPATSVPVGTSITFSYSVPSAGVTSTNWVGIYEAGQTPGDVGSTTYQYTPDASGTVTFATTLAQPGQLRRLLPVRQRLRRARRAGRLHRHRGFALRGRHADVDRHVGAERPVDHVQLLGSDRRRHLHELGRHLRAGPDARHRRLHHLPVHAGRQRHGHVQHQLAGRRGQLRRLLLLRQRLPDHRRAGQLLGHARHPGARAWPTSGRSARIS